MRRIDIGKRLLAAHEGRKRIARQWVEYTLKLAVGLAEARKDWTRNQDFHDWLISEGLIDLSHQDRGALIDMGKHPIEAERILRQTTSRSVRLINAQMRRDRRRHLTNAGNMVEQIDQPPEAPAAPPSNVVSLRPQLNHARQEQAPQYRQGPAEIIEWSLPSACIAPDPPPKPPTEVKFSVTVPFHMHLPVDIDDKLRERAAEKGIRPTDLAVALLAEALAM